MADTSTTVSGPVTVKSDSAERVAFELFRFIRGGTPEQQDKELELFSRCLFHATRPGESVEDGKTSVKRKFL